MHRSRGRRSAARLVKDAMYAARLADRVGIVGVDENCATATYWPRLQQPIALGRSEAKADVRSFAFVSLRSMGPAEPAFVE